MDNKIRELVGLAPPPSEVFEFQAPVQDFERRGVKGQGGWYFPDRERTEKEGYIPGKGCFEYFRAYDGHPAPLFPCSRIPFWDTLQLLAPLKRDINIVFRLLAAREARFVVLCFGLMGKKGRGRFLNKISELFNEKSLDLLRFKYLRDDYYSLPVREIIGFIERFLVLLGVERYNAERTARTIGMMFENDQAYCWRFQDMMTEAWEHHLKSDPYCEAKRLVKILIERDPAPEGLEYKYNAILKALKYGLWLPSIRKALKKALEPLNMENCKLTENDIYHTLLYGSYNIQGKSPEERLKIYEGYHGTDQSKWPARWELT